jgi:phage major head subunit gpT-like protein
MDVTEFRASLAEPSPPSELKQSAHAELSRALWLDAKGDFDAAHAIAQDVDGPEGARVHAYLHRKEGDLSNARYWYRLARTDEVKGTLEAEWESLVRRYL